VIVLSINLGLPIIPKCGILFYHWLVYYIYKSRWYISLKTLLKWRPGYTIQNVHLELLIKQAPDRLHSIYRVCWSKTWRRHIRRSEETFRRAY